MSKIAIFASGEGSNADQLMGYFQKMATPLTVHLVVTNKPNAPVIQKAEKRGVSVKIIKNDELLTDQFVDDLIACGIEWIVLAGFLRKIPSALIERFNGKIINLHPSLLPKYGGKGMYGKRVHEKVIAEKERTTGITIHLVNEAYDEGRILAQFEAEVSENETVETLIEKIHRLEHKHFAPVVYDYIGSEGI